MAGIVIVLLVCIVIILAIVILSLLCVCIALLKWARDHGAEDVLDGRVEEYFDYAWSQIFPSSKRD